MQSTHFYVFFLPWDFGNGNGTVAKRSTFQRHPHCSLEAFKHYFLSHSPILPFGHMLSVLVSIFKKVKREYKGALYFFYIVKSPIFKQHFCWELGGLESHAQCNIRNVCANVHFCFSKSVKTMFSNY